MSLSETNLFFKSFNSLDKLLKDIYPCDISGQLGITSYLKEMDRVSYKGKLVVQNWQEDYNRLVIYRKNRNKAVHEDMLDSDLFKDSDILWIDEFKKRVLAQEDPISLLQKTLIAEARRVKKKPAKELFPRKKFKSSPKRNLHRIIGIILLGISVALIMIVLCVWVMMLV